MKHSKLLAALTVLIAGFTIQAAAQDLPEIRVIARNYKYLRAVDGKDMAQPVRLMEHKAASYDIKSSDFYEDDYDNYSINFYLPHGYVLAVYDNSGKVIRTAEQYKNITLPITVRKAIVERFPNWIISDNIYLVTYDNTGGSIKNYKVTLYNGSKRLKVKTNEKGEFLD